MNLRYALISVLMFLFTVLGMAQQINNTIHIENGMTYRQVKRIVGTDGFLKGKTKNSKGEEVSIYEWSVKDGGSLTATFKDDVVSKWSFQEGMGNESTSSDIDVSSINFDISPINLDLSKIYDEDLREYLTTSQQWYTDGAKTRATIIETYVKQDNGNSAASSIFRSGLPNAQRDYEDHIKAGPQPIFFGDSRGKYSSCPGAWRIKIGRVGWMRGKVIQIIDSSTMLLSTENDDESIIVMVKGISTTGLVDDSKIASRSLMKVTGSGSYTSVLGAKKTVFVLEPFEVTPFIDKVPKLLLTKD